MKNYLDDLFFLLGAGLIIYATYHLDHIAALFVAGGFCILISLLIGIKDGDHDLKKRS